MIELATAESCAACDVPQREHCQRWTPAAGWHGWIAPDRALIAARIRVRYQAKGWIR